MNTLLNYRIENLEDFTTEFLSRIDTSIDYFDFTQNPNKLIAAYFGKVEWSNFTIYQQNKLLSQPKIFLKIDGEISENILSLRINYHHLWIVVGTSLLLTFFSIYMMFKFPIYAGLILLLITAAQTYFGVRHYIKSKKIFLKWMEEIEVKRHIRRL